MRNLFEDAEVWIDPSDKHTWFKDEACTVPATQPHDVRWLKNKSKGSVRSFSVGKLGSKEHGKYFMRSCRTKYMQVGGVGAICLHNKAESEEALEELERKFMRDLQIQLRALSALTYEDKNG